MSTDVRDHGRRIEELLDAVEAAAGPQAWPRVEALVAALLELQGEAFERMLGCARAEARSAAALDGQLAEDEIVSSVLLLHGLHPLILEDRIDLALRRVSSAAPQAASLELVGVDDGVVSLRVASSSGGGVGRPPMTLPTELAVSAIERAAPEIARVSIEGLAPSPSTLVPIERLVRHGRHSEGGGK